MAFNFLVEDGSGLGNATSYVSVAEADDILAVNIHADADWVNIDDEIKEKLLSWASQYIDTKARWRGEKTVETSALRWPRKGVRDRDNIELADDVVPRQLKIAVSALATWLVDRDPSVVEAGQGGISRIKADVIEIEFTEGQVVTELPKYLHALIDGLGFISTGRPRFARIIR
jgi:hypothetical protein